MKLIGDIVIAAPAGVWGPADGSGLRAGLTRVWEWLFAGAFDPLRLAVKSGQDAKGKARKPAPAAKPGPGKSKSADPGRGREEEEAPGENEDAPDEPEDDAETDADADAEEDLDEELIAEEEAAEEEEDAGPIGRDPDLIAGFLEGSEECFGRLVEKYQHKVYNLCCRIMGDRDEAMDMAQEVFITVHKSLAGFRGDSQFSTWIFRVTVNHCKNRIKYLGRRRYYQTTSIDQPQELGDGEVYFELEDESPDPELTVASEEIQAVVQGAISGLDSDHRVAVVLRDIQGLSYEEIAEILGIKVGTVKSRIHRARGELKKKLEGRFKKKAGG